jgi:hypothetical protein
MPSQSNIVARPLNVEVPQASATSLIQMFSRPTPMVRSFVFGSQGRGAWGESRALAGREAQNKG